ncbi:Acyl-CoA N-acyltransferase with RING/FYVE/PHD-type zinc finger domain [Striga hermonthica]|uniref:Acyl-CoA N-acyltransferase with RING/FYVE/PHD-type zinc finger domain n=1 Tax=Striga hermonthica TaxID=68872 RepID=A0A9N7RIY8_STRHE|nr:Acyl-CoA N-acyltransferase with RING/FYVE/PHD-type zinc finger domain [Striga hermonthica]
MWVYNSPLLHRAYAPGLITIFSGVVLSASSCILRFWLFDEKGVLIGDGEEVKLLVNYCMTEMNTRVIESDSGHHLAGDNESCLEEANEKPCIDNVISPCAVTGSVGVMIESNCSASVQVTDKVLDCMDDSRTKGSSKDTESQPVLETRVNDPKSCSEIDLKECDNCTESEPCSGSGEDHCLGKLENETPNNLKVESEPVVKDGEMDTCMEDRIGGVEPCTENGVKEPTNDDVHSEVSNPNPSPKHVASSLTISSQVDVVGSDHGGCGEITSVCQSLYADDSFCESKLESFSKDSVVLEIPKHVRPSGIRKITFKFSKRKVVSDGDQLAAVEPLDDYKSDEGFYDNRVSLSPSARLTRNDFENQGWSALENEELNLNLDCMEFQDSRSPSFCAPNRELKMSKKVVPDNYPTSVKKLLSTGILEGARVKYISISGMKEIPAVIKDGGYLCGCCSCNFSKVVSAYEFEIHAGAKTRHPNHRIYLENGKPIYSIIEELRNAPLSTIDSVIKAVAGSSVNEEYLRAWKDPLSCFMPVFYCNSLQAATVYGAASGAKAPGQEVCSPPPSHPPSLSLSLSLFTHTCRFLSSNIICRPRQNNSYWEQKKVGEGGNKKRHGFCLLDNDLHKLLFMPNGLPDGTDVAYYSKGKRILKGYKQGNGIVCSCCNSEISPSQFEAHAGGAAKRQPYRHIYAASGLTLHDIALMLANGQNINSSGSDDMCAVCGDRGELMICNGCPRAFHAACLGLQCPPTGDWHCQYCKDRFGPGRKASSGSRHIILRLNRVVKAPEFEPGGCVICRSQDFSAVKFDDRTVIICDQCEKEYHVGCLRELGLCDLKELPEDKWFCRDECHKIFEALQNLACSGPKVIPASVSGTIYEKHEKLGFNTTQKNDIQWCVLNGKSRFPEHILLLSRAAAIFRECFDPIVAKSGRDLIPVMVYGRNISGQEFSGMYCVVLIVQSVVVSAALLRIFGRDVAELPLVATSRENQGKGYFQALFSCIERLLSSMSVKHLVLPAAEEAEPMWTNKLGFRKTSSEQMLRYRDYQLTVFKDLDGNGDFTAQVRSPSDVVLTILRVGGRSSRCRRPTSSPYPLRPVAVSQIRPPAFVLSDPSPSNFEFLLHVLSRRSVGDGAASPITTVHDARLHLHCRAFAKVLELLVCSDAGISIDLTLGSLRLITAADDLGNEVCAVPDEGPAAV